MIKKFSGDDFDQILEEINRFLIPDGKTHDKLALCTDTTILHNGKIIILLTYENA